jgi:hypothetical protein
MVLRVTEYNPWSVLSPTGDKVGEMTYKDGRFRVFNNNACLLYKIKLKEWEFLYDREFYFNEGCLAILRYLQGNTAFV